MLNYFIGVDGGGSKTSISIADVQMHVMHQFYCGAINMNGQNIEQTRATLQDMQHQMHKSGYDNLGCLGISIGMAGISNIKSINFVKQCLKEFGFVCDIFFFGDHETALATAFKQCHGIILISGTGSICFGMSEDERQIRAGGYGHLIDDAGSAYDISIHMLKAIVRSEEGREPKTILKQLVFDKLGICNVKELIQFLYNPLRSKKEIAALAVLLEQAIEQKDEAAYRIEDYCVNELISLSTVVIKKLPGENQMAFGGSVLTKNIRIQNKVKQGILKDNRDLNIVILTQNPSVGALRLLQKKSQFHGGKYETLFGN